MATTTKGKKTKTVEKQVRESPEINVVLDTTSHPCRFKFIEHKDQSATIECRTTISNKELKFDITLKPLKGYKHKYLGSSLLARTTAHYKRGLAKAASEVAKTHLSMLLSLSKT